MITARSYAVAGDGGKVMVSISGLSIRIAWPCGDARTFTVEQAANAIEAVKVARKAEHTVSLSTMGQPSPLYVEVVDGELYADTKLPIARETHVPWSELRRSVRKLSATLLEERVS